MLHLYTYIYIYPYLYVYTTIYMLYYIYIHTLLYHIYIYCNMSIESCKSADLSLEVSKFERNGGLMGTHENNKY